MTRPELVSGAEIGRRLGVSRERVRQWAADQKSGFPDPIARVGRSVVWEWPPVERWAKRRDLQRRQPTVAPVAATKGLTGERRDTS